ncbi:MAG: NUDIX domain-containing protein [Treponema sp.]|nr:NUDIX domain-containing protein [Treponema sp.]
MSCHMNFTFCPLCSSKKINFVDNKKWFCSDCGFDLYHNVAAAVNVIIADKNGFVLFEKRAKEPRKNFLALPGGFVDADEGAEQAAMRECKEEAGLVIQRVTYLCSLPNTYEYKNIVYKTCDTFYTADLPAGIESVATLTKTLCAQKSEVQEFIAVRIVDERSLDAVPLAFENARSGLRIWLEARRLFF